MKYALFSIGMTLYELYFNDFPFSKKSDYQLYEDIFKKNINIMNLNYDPLEDPLLEGLREKFKKHQEKEALNKEENNMNRTDRFITNLAETKLIKKEEKEEALILTISKKRDFWIENLCHKLSENRGQKFFADELRYDLIYKLINYNSKENITNYNDYFNHPFLAQYNY